MARYLTVFLLAALFGLASASRLSAASNEGQSDLDRATEVKLTAENIDDLNLVITLAQGAAQSGTGRRQYRLCQEALGEHVDSTRGCVFQSDLRSKSA